MCVPPMEDFLHRLAHKNLQKRTFGLIENGSWAPCAAKGMKGILEGMKEVNICENVVSIKSTMKDTDVAKMEELAKKSLHKTGTNLQKYILKIFR